MPVAFGLFVWLSLFLSSGISQFSFSDVHHSPKMMMQKMCFWSSQMQWWSFGLTSSFYTVSNCLCLRVWPGSRVRARSWLVGCASTAALWFAGRFNLHFSRSFPRPNLCFFSNFLAFKMLEFFIGNFQFHHSIIVEDLRFHQHIFIIRHFHTSFLHLCGRRFAHQFLAFPGGFLSLLHLASYYFPLPGAV